MLTKNNLLSIYILVSIYIVLNLVYKKYINIVIFLISFLIINNCIRNITNSLIAAYIISICYGIFKNFHLLENFSIKNTYETKDKLENDILHKNLNKEKNDESIKIKLNPTIKSILSDRLLKTFIKKLKDEDDSSIFTRKVKITDLKPTITELSNGKIKKMIKNKGVLDKPIVISSDNFIVDGHHRWFANKSQLKNKSLGDNDEQQFITATIININVDKLFKKIKEFKRDYNEKNLDNFELDDNKIKKAKISINSIKNNISVLDNLFQDLHKINLV